MPLAGLWQSFVGCGTRHSCGLLPRRLANGNKTSKRISTNSEVSPIRQSSTYLTLLLERTRQMRQLPTPEVPPPPPATLARETATHRIESKTRRLRPPRRMPGTPGSPVPFDPHRALKVWSISISRTASLPGLLAPLSPFVASMPSGIKLQLRSALDLDHRRVASTRRRCGACGGCNHP